MFDKLLQRFINLNEKESRIFATGILCSSLYWITLFSLMNKNTIDLSNLITDFKRMKILNKSKNIFYFDYVIDSKSLEDFRNFIFNLDNSNEPIYIVLSTNGGSFSIVQMISDILLKYEGETNAIILNKAFSAGTLITLSCKNIYMHKNAYLSPVDVIHQTFFDSTQLTSINNVLSNKNKDKINDQTYILADQARKCKIILDKIFNKISVLHKFNDEVKKNVYSEIFEGEKYIHSTTFSTNELIDMGIKIKPITEEFIQIAKLTKTYRANVYF